MKITQSGFIESNGFFYPDYPRKQVLEMLKYAHSGTALDIGAGFGNNTIPLLKSGFDVTATETNSECVDELHKLSKEHPEKLHVIDQPLEDLKFDARFDSVVCTMVLHFLARPDALTAITNMKAWTSDGGICVITGYTDHNTDLDNDFDFLFHTNELHDLFTDWEILAYEEVMSGTKNPAGKSFQSAKLIAKKSSIS